MLAANMLPQTLIEREQRVLDAVKTVDAGKVEVAFEKGSKKAKQGHLGS